MPLNIPAQTEIEETQTVVLSTLENEILQISSTNDDNHDTRETDLRSNNNFQNAA